MTAMAPTREPVEGVMKGMSKVLTLVAGSNRFEEQMGRKISLVLFVLAAMIVAPAVADEPKVVAKAGEPSLASREQEYPETAAMLDRITAIIEGGGDLQDISYIEKLFNVHFSEPVYINYAPAPDGGPSPLRIERNNFPKSLNGEPVKLPDMILYHRINIVGVKQPPSEPYPPPKNVSLEISSKHVCFRLSDFQPLFDTGPRFVPILDAGAKKYEKSDGAKTVSLLIVEGWLIPSADKRYPVVRDGWDRKKCPVTRIEISFSYAPTSHQNNGGLQ